MARLFLQFKDKILQVFQLSGGQMITIGRRHSNDIVIENLAVSGNHARINCRPAGFMLEDLQNRLPANQPSILTEVLSVHE